MSFELLHIAFVNRSHLLLRHVPRQVQPDVSRHEDLPPPLPFQGDVQQSVGESGRDPQLVQGDRVRLEVDLNRTALEAEEVAQEGGDEVRVKEQV